MPRDTTVNALDIGTSKICALLAEAEPSRDGHSPELNIVGVGEAPSRGMRKGVVVNIDEVSTSINEAVEQCVRLSDRRFDWAYVGVTGGHIAGLNTKGVVAVSSSAQEIASSDVDRAMEAARVQAISHDREVIHVIPRGYTLDGQDGVRDPVGMSGHRLEAQIHIVTGATTSIHNLVRAVRRAGITMRELVLQPLASAEAVLTAQEREAGVALVDIGGGTTDISIFHDQGVAHTVALPVGGFHITNDLALGLRAPLALAEEVKLRYGSAVVGDIGEDEVIELRTYDNEEGEPISRRLIAQIIEARMLEIFALVKREIDRTGFGRLLPAGTVLTGGTAELKDIRKLGREVLGMPVRIGQPSRIVGLTDSITRPGYATSVGLLLWPRSAESEVLPAATSGEKPWRPPESGKFTRWLREFLP